MVSTDINVKTLKINQLTEAQYNAAVQGGIIGANELSFITDATYTTTLPSQTGHAGEYLTTNGTDLSWGSLANIAITGEYSDLLNVPTVPTTLVELIGDVNISSPTNGQHLVYDSTTQKWKNQTSTVIVSWGSINGTLSNQTDLQNALDTKVDKGHEVIAFQVPTAANNYTWYRKYADGWVEQGGRTEPFTNTSGGQSKAVTLPIEMSSSVYNISLSLGYFGASGGGSGWPNRQFVATDIASTGFVFNQSILSGQTASGTGMQGIWQVSGMVA